MITEVPCRCNSTGVTFTLFQIDALLTSVHHKFNVTCHEIYDLIGLEFIREYTSYMNPQLHPLQSAVKTPMRYRLG